MTEDPPAPAAGTPRDSVDALIASWGERRPDLDFAPLGVISRLARVRSHIDLELERVFEAHGLSAANFAVLVTLARIAEHGGVNQKRLMDELGLTSGTISIRMDRLADAGLIERLPDPESRRNTLIVLTDRGRELVERVTPAHLANERRLLCSLSDGEQEMLAGLLRRMLAEFEGSSPPSREQARLGITVAPAHKSMAMRESVGLDAFPALLVRAVSDGGPAQRAGIRTGDLLVRAGGRELRSVACLHAAIDEAAAARCLHMQLLRGTAQVDLTVEFETTPPPQPGDWSTAWRTARGEHVI